MSYEAWGDDDDGLDGVRESYRKTLLEDGWLNDEQAVLVTADAKRYRWLCANGRYRADWWGRFGTPEELSAAIDKAIDKDTTSALSANSPATKGTGVTPASDNANPPMVKLVYNKITKRIDKVRTHDGLVLESFEPPCDYYYEPKDVMGQRAAAIRHGDVVSGETQVNQGTFGSEKP